MAIPFLNRGLDIADLLKNKSYFLFGPRQTGKTSLIKHCLPGIRSYDLLDNALFLELSANPGRLAQEITLRDSIVVIDEIQRLPILLNEAHRLIEEKRIHFLLTGSSARKLRSRGVNLLGGRARVKHLHPFTTEELGTYFDLTRALNAGLIPSIYFSEDPQTDLAAYVGNYLKEEIIAESVTRNIPAFSRFLKISGQANAKIINFTKIANDAQVPRTTIYEYYEILKDTLILRELPAFRAGVKRKPICASKYYFFDIGVSRYLQGRKSYAPRTEEFGDAFETFIVNEVFAWSDYRGAADLSYWRSTAGQEVDLLINDHTAVEIKGKSVISPDDLRGLKAIAAECPFKRYVCLSLEQRTRRIGNIEVLPYQDFLRELWD
ncbi:MAG: ATP-binding protein [Candidatus Omnitrophica bacterium]|nr:ATP-binding protein [Candidatus Omnitrophota bacterium]